MKMLKSLDEAKSENTPRESILDEYPKLRKPRPETLRKVQAHQKSTDNISMIKAGTNTKGEQNVEIPLHQRFLLKKEQIEKATRKSLNNSEQILVNIFYTKVKAHPNGFFAENLPQWYKNTFNKDLTLDWLKLLEVSNKFEIEIIQIKTVFYAKDIKEDPITNIDVSDSGYKDYSMDLVSKGVTMFNTKECDMRSESSVPFVRYKHLQISLKEYAKNARLDNAGESNK